MPFGNFVASGTRLPWASRDRVIQQSSMLTYVYPASRSPADTNASAVARTSESVTLQPNAFQSFQPIRGVRARPFSSARAAAGRTTAATVVRMVAAVSTTAQAPAVIVDLFMAG